MLHIPASWTIRGCATELGGCARTPRCYVPFVITHLPAVEVSSQPPVKMAAARDDGPTVLTPGLKANQEGEMNQVATTTAVTNAPRVRRRRSWLRIFVGGLALWVATVLVTFATQNSNLIPTIILLGSFLVPVTFVFYAFGHADQMITPQRIFGAFVVGGIL